MKNSRIIKKGGVSLLSIALTLAIIFSTGFSAPAFAADDMAPGQTKTYTRDNSTASFQIGDYIGKCCETGTPSGQGGTATVERQVDNTTLVARMAYYFTYVENRFADGSSVPGLDETWDVMMAHAIGYADMGRAAWRSAMAGLDFSTSEIDARENVVQSMINKCQNYSVPSNFKIYRMNTSDGLQDFMVWKLAEEGSLTVKKNLTTGGSSSESFTFKITVGSISGTYSGVTFSNGVARINLRGGESKTIEGLPADTSYQVVEENIPATWLLESKTGDSGTITNGSTATATFVNKPAPGKLKLKKASSNTSITG